MKKNLTDSLYREIAGSGDGSTVDQVSTLLERQLKGQKLTKREESVLAEVDKGLADLLAARQDGYSPEKPAKQQEPSPLPFSSFAEGLARLQNRIQKRKVRPQLRTSKDAGAYRPDKGAKGGAVKVSAAKVAAIVKMAREERAKQEKLKKRV
jgi:hypothetical protein